MQVRAATITESGLVCLGSESRPRPSLGPAVPANGMAEQARCGLEKGARLVDSRAPDPGEIGALLVSRQVSVSRPFDAASESSSWGIILYYCRGDVG
jgi:hypothetical protein